MDYRYYGRVEEGVRCKVVESFACTRDKSSTFIIKTTTGSVTVSTTPLVNNQTLFICTTPMLSYITSSCIQFLLPYTSFAMTMKTSTTNVFRMAAWT